MKNQILGTMEQLQEAIKAKCPELSEQMSAIIDMVAAGQADKAGDVTYVVCMLVSSEDGNESYYHPVVMPRLNASDNEKFYYMIAGNDLEQIQVENAPIIKNMESFGKVVIVSVPANNYAEISEKLDNLMSQVHKACQDVLDAQYRLNALLGRYMEKENAVKELVFATLQEARYTGHGFTAEKEVVDRTGEMLEEDMNRQLLGDDEEVEDEDYDEDDDDYDDYDDDYDEDDGYDDEEEE